MYSLDRKVLPSVQGTAFVFLKSFLTLLIVNLHTFSILSTYKFQTIYPKVFPLTTVHVRHPFCCCFSEQQSKLAVFIAPALSECCFPFWAIRPLYSHYTEEESKARDRAESIAKPREPPHVAFREKVQWNSRFPCVRSHYLLIRRNTFP